MGLSYGMLGQRNLENRPKCNAEPLQAKNVMILEVVAFSLFLFSSLVAKSLKVNFQIYDNGNFKIDETRQGYKVGKAILQEPIHTRSSSTDDYYYLCWYAHLSTSSHCCST
ncbi:hypothetical protein ACSBR2_032372 [Camellia fascicularis]